MPTFTAIALDRLVEHGSRTATVPTPRPPPLPPVRAENSRPVPSNAGTARPHVSPALYTTPVSTALPDSPSSFSPSSPYIINHKRRGPRLLKTVTMTEENGNSDVGKESGKGEESKKVADDGVVAVAESGVEQQIMFEFQQEQLSVVDVGSSSGAVGDEDLTKVVDVDEVRYGENDDFFDLQDSLSTVSNTDVNMDVDDVNERSAKMSTPVGEFFDACDEISSDGASRFSRDIEDDMREMRLSLLMEIEKRKQAEEALESFQSQWKRLNHHLSLVGLTLPPPPTVAESTEDSSIDPVAQLCQQVTVSRFVAAAFARASARAEVEEEYEPLIATKNFEIARLSDKVQFYEAANREMSHRNQEAVETARQERNRRKRRLKWFWGSVGLAVTVGAAAIAWSYLPCSKPNVSKVEDNPS